MKSVILLLLFYSEIAIGVDPPKWILQQNRDSYMKYEECIQKREMDMDRFQNSKRFNAIFAPQNSLVIMECLECLNPIEARTIEDKWKPNESFISRKVQHFFDKITEAIKRNKTKPETNESFEYYWEFLPYINGENETWHKIIDMYESSDISVKVAKMMNKFLHHDKERYAVGNHYELKIEQSNFTDTGWYRCIKRVNEKDEYISRIYFLDIPSFYNVKMTEYSSDLMLNTKIKVHNSVELFYRKSSWTKCNKCGKDVGERRMQSMASVTRPEITFSKFSALQFFGELPCISLLLNDSRKLWELQYPIYEVFQKCQIACPPSRNETRIVQGFDEDGTRIVLDKLLPGEYDLSERLPPLREHVRRKIMRPFVDDYLVLDCGGSQFSAENNVIWHKDFVEFNASTLLKKKLEENRVILTATNRIIFMKTKVEDSGLYTCLGRNETLGIFIVYVNEATGYVAYFSMAQLIIRFIAAMFLLLLFISEIGNVTRKLDIINKKAKAEKEFEDVKTALEKTMP